MAFQKKINLSWPVLTWTFSMFSLSLFFILLGAYNNNPGAFRVSTVYLAWPILYTVLLSGINKKEVFWGLLRTMVFTSIILSIYMIIFVLNTAGVWPDFLFFNVYAEQNIGLYDGFVENGLPSIASLIFIVPFLICSLVIWPAKSDVISRKVLISAVILSVVAMLLSGRRALWLSVFISILMFLCFYATFSLVSRYKMYSFKSFLAKFFLLLLISSCLTPFIFKAFNLDFASLLQYFLSSFDVNAYDGSASARYIQFDSLVNGWMQMPLLGAGHGAQASVIRSDESPWAYELTYIAMLFHTGIVGTLGYLLGVVWIYWKSVRIIASPTCFGPYLVSILVGTTAFLMANATNPYLAKYDFMWVLFLPLSVINLYSISRDGRGDKSLNRR